MFKIDRNIREEFCKYIKNTDLLTREFNKEDIQKTIKEVYNLPMIFSKMKGRGNIKIEVFNLLDSIGEEIFNFFNNHLNSLTKNEFDEFFFKISSNFLNSYNDAASKCLNTKILDFGLIQKIINTTFKYLSCFKDYDKYPHLFTYCHISIDQLTLYYFKIHNIAGDIYGERIEGLIFSTRYSIPTKHDYKDWFKLDIDRYKRLLNDYRINLNNLYPAHSPLNIEFYIYNYIINNREEDSIIFRLSKTY